jgi:CRISPR type I-E-associated protein CasA/Cse1
MNLCKNAWIPVVDNKANHRAVSLEELFQDAASIQDLAASPPERIALTRLLVCIIQAALDGPATESDWAKCKGSIISASLAYLKAHEGCFELYKKNGGFLQVPNLTRADNASVNKLDLGFGENTPRVWDHSATPEQVHTPEWLALHLLTCQCFALGGFTGVATWNGVKIPKNVETAPCVEGSMLHVLLRGHNLLDTLHLNLLTKEDIKTLDVNWGRPMWEKMPKEMQSDTKIVNTYLGRLVPISRAIALNPENPGQMTVTAGLRYLKLDTDHREPNTTVVMGKDKKLHYIRMDRSKNPWRELASVLAIPKGDDVGHTALVLNHFRQMRKSNPDAEVDIWVGGVAASKSKMIDTGEWNFKISVSIWDGDSALDMYRAGVESAEVLSRKLAKATVAFHANLGTKLKPAQKKLVGQKATRLFWSRLEVLAPILQRLSESRASPAQLEEQWNTQVYRAARDTYAKVCSHENPRQLRAFVEVGQVFDTQVPHDT